MIDYKNFLTIMNGNSNVHLSEKYDWAEHALSQIKQWHHQSKLTPEDSFRILDKDGDTYINEKDLHDFLIEKLKYQ